MPDTARRLHHVEHVMGTVFSFDIRDQPTPAIHRALAHAVRALHTVDTVFSTYRPDSAISRLGRGDIRLADCPPEVHEVLSLCAHATHASDGWFSITPDGSLDPSGLVKGWATEAASQLLYESGARHTCVNGGGDLQLRGQAAPGAPWRIGIAHPLHPGELATVITAEEDLAIATSGTAERGAHILNPYHGAEGALRFGCLLDLARKPEGALWWWQFAAGAGNATAAYCLYLFHTRRGDLRDAAHWWYQHRALGPSDLDLPRAGIHGNVDTSSGVLRQAVERLKVDEAAGEFHHPDRRLADQIGKLVKLLLTPTHSDRRD